MSDPENTRPRLTGTRWLRNAFSSTVFIFTFNNVCFSIVAADIDEDAGAALLPADYDFDESIEGKILIEINELSTYDSDQPLDPAKRDAAQLLEKQLAGLAADACLTTMRRLARTKIPEARTLQDILYPPNHILQILTERDKLVCRTLDDPTALVERHPPVSEERLRATGLNLDNTDLLVVEPSQVILVRHVHNLVWRVNVEGEELICKESLDLFEHAVGDELATYLKVKAAGLRLNVPELRGVIQSHRGVVGILLSYIPHKHHSLRNLLAGVEQGTVPQSEATPILRQKWARQIRETLAGLHGLGILWRDVETDNVLIDDNGDAVVLDFGGATRWAGLTMISTQPCRGRSRGFGESWTLWGFRSIRRGA